MKHFFSVTVAEKLGVNCAIILENLWYWIEKNKANEKHFHDDNYWTYNSRKAYAELFPYLTERQIEYALRRLVDEGYIITGNYNKASFDRTLWYAITKKGYSILQNCEMERTQSVNGSTENVRAIPDNKPNKNNKNPLPTVEGEQAPSSRKSSYKDILSADDNKYVKEALEKFLHYCRGKNYTPKVVTVKGLADTLRDNAGDDPKLAMAIVDQSIENGWKSLYPLKRYSNGGKYRDGAVMKKWDGKTAKDANGNDIVF